MKIIAHAKINLALDIIGKRRDGYHILDMIMLPISLSDILTIYPSDIVEVKVTGNEQLKGDGNNLAMKAALALKEKAHVENGATITIEKYIPMGAGLGGGSSDAAAVLVGLNKIWNCGFSVRELAEIGHEIGSDVPFFVYGGAARVQGTGEMVSPIFTGNVLNLCVVKPKASLSTKEIFEKYDTFFGTINHPNVDQTEIELLCLIPYYSNYAGNVLQSVSSEACPQIKYAVQQLEKAGAEYAMMTGSGSAVFGIFSSEDDARAVTEKLKEEYDFAEYCSTTLRTMEILEDN